MRARVRVRYGQPIDLSPYYGREKDSELVRQLLVQCVKAIAELAGRPDFEPQIAGPQVETGLVGARASGLATMRSDLTAGAAEGRRGPCRI